MTVLATSDRVRVGCFEVRWSEDSPAVLGAENALLGRDDIVLVEIFTAAEQRRRTSQAYARSAVGARLRVIAVDDVAPRAAGHGWTVVVVQRDPLTGIEVRSTLTAPASVTALRVQHELRNGGTSEVVLTTVASASVGFGAKGLDGLEILLADSEWLAENRWHGQPLRALLPDLSLPVHAQDGRGRATLTSHGSWSTGEHLPIGIVHDRDDGAAFAWQIESGAGWHVDLSQDLGGATVGLFGPTDLEHQFAHRCAPGATFTTVPVALAVSGAGPDGAIAALTGYRRALRAVEGAASLPVVYNDFMNTLMGQPSSEALRPLIAAAADAGAEVFCIDAGWFADPALGDWWSTVGEWREAPARFDTAGLAGITDGIRARGMRVGLWLEPEVVGVDSPTARQLPEEAFFRRFGQRVQEHGRYHLDFRHAAVRAHLDETVDVLVREYGVSYLKLDYNINPGAGTESEAAAAGDGLLGHLRAFRSWLVDLQRRHPGLLLENCSSGAMRADYALLEVTHLQSTSDQQDFLRYPPIAASAPASILPEQCGNWAYPAAGMTVDETGFTLVTGLSGRLYLSGFLDQLRPEQKQLLAEAVALHRELRDQLCGCVPFWPLGLPGWEDDAVCLGYRLADGSALLFVWDRSEAAGEILLPGVFGAAERIFPERGQEWALSAESSGLRIRTEGGVSAGVLRLTGPGEAEAP
ncbi:glycoside hydrolase family 36 protein [Microbacterium panaciterrae]|uniref:Alpha-galactosidase n=1 Tax=Microbacterium panaciterrae TaxID=985759 RepID=A0ABP8PTH6_9MICO